MGLSKLIFILQLLQQQQQAEALRQQQLKQQQQAEQARQQEALRQQQIKQQQEQQQQQQQQQAEQARKQEALRQQQAQAAAKQQQQQQAAALQAQQRAAAEQKAQLQQQQQQQSQSGIDMLSSGLGNLGLSGGQDNRSVDSSNLQLGGAPGQSGGASVNSAIGGNVDASGSTYLGALNDSLAAAPGTGEKDRSRQYTPQNPYPTPASYPSTPAAIFENPAVFEKLGTDCLFFIFYYAQGTYQQYLAARELKKQSWRFHKKYMTWFQRHEEPKITTDEYEQGTYVYFDYETGWCTRIKQDFRFEYSFLEDSLQ